jgi:hypothetical protein
MNTCFHSIDQTPVVLPAIGTEGEYVMPPIITSEGIEHAPGFRVPVRVIMHIGKFGLQLEEIARPNFAIECHYTSFEAHLPANPRYRLCRYAGRGWGIIDRVTMGWRDVFPTKSEAETCFMALRSISMP